MVCEIEERIREIEIKLAVHEKIIKELLSRSNRADSDY